MIPQIGVANTIPTGQYQSTDILTRLSSISTALNNPDINMNSQGRFVFFLLFLLNYCCPH